MKTIKQQVHNKHTTKINLLSDRQTTAVTCVGSLLTVQLIY